jgi:hypothetical protein
MKTLSSQGVIGTSRLCLLCLGFYNSSGQSAILHLGGHICPRVRGPDAGAWLFIHMLVSK